jgi:hypothetical protein
VNLRSPSACSAVGLLALALGGCATPGPTHVYWAAASDSAVHDLETASGERRSLDGQIAKGEEIVGLAYDQFTDYLFLRLSPGDVVRIVNRPAGSRVRDLKLNPEVAVAPGETPVNSLDLTVRSRNRHLFAIDPREPAIIEFTPAGEMVRKIKLANPPRGPVGGLGFDDRRDRLVVLFASSPAVLVEVTLDGASVHQTNLAAAVHPVSLGCDAEAGEYFVPLADGAIGVFDREGHLLRQHQVPAGVAPAAIGAGPRAFLRVF